jgi:myo-inositol-1(or 4)-monophosphatase
MPSPSPDFDLNADFALLIAAIREGGALSREHAGRDVKVLTKADNSPVSEIDLAVDDILQQRLRAARPAYGWLSEESAAPFAERDRPRAWIVDPIDGTRAFLKGLPEFCTAGALVENGEAVLAAVYNPMTEEFYAAIRGQGATLNGAPVHASQIASLTGATISVGNEKVVRKALGPDVPERLVVQQTMSLSLRFALVAAGRFDAAMALGLKADWDVAPGALLICEAGGRAMDQTGAAFRFNRERPAQQGVVAAGRGLHPLLQSRLAAHAS